MKGSYRGRPIVLRYFSSYPHVLTMLYAQLTHAISLNDVCDALKRFSGPLSAIRGAAGLGAVQALKSH